MPQLERFFHYRNLDVSTLKELARRWAPNIGRGFSKESAHTA
jgi:oligoribonuclease